jgi:hypothetical protein
MSRRVFLRVYIPVVREQVTLSSTLLEFILYVNELQRSGAQDNVHLHRTEEVVHRVMFTSTEQRRWCTG